MNDFRKKFVSAGILCFVLSLFQALLGLSPSLSHYYGAPEALVNNRYLLFFASLIIAGILALFGLYALSGAGSIRKLPFLKQGLVVISATFIIRGLLLLPELLVVLGVIHVPIPVAPRFVLFSLGSLLIGILFSAGLIGGWQSLSNNAQHLQPGIPRTDQS